MDEDPELGIFEPLGEFEFTGDAAVIEISTAGTEKGVIIADAVRLRVHIAPGIAFGPGKADLPEGIRETGSIAAAGRQMRMSYKRAWQLVEELNGLFDAPLVERNVI